MTAQDIGQWSDAQVVVEPIPPEPADRATGDASHPVLVELQDRAEVAQRTYELAGVRTRGNPELTLATAASRGLYGERYQQTITLAISIPFGSDSRNRAGQANSMAELIEAQSHLSLERHRLHSEIGAARSRVGAVQAQLNAAQKGAQLARESRGFFHKSYQMGETDLPTRLRIEIEAVSAERQAARTRVELAAAISALRQSMGLLPQ